MTRDRKDLGARKHARVDLRKPGFLIPAPDEPWIERHVIDISENGACLEVGDLAVPNCSAFPSPRAVRVLRVCTLIWRSGELIGARLVSAKELRQGQMPASEAGPTRPEDSRVIRPKLNPASPRPAGFGRRAFWIHPAAPSAIRRFRSACGKRRRPYRRRRRSFPSHAAFRSRNSAPSLQTPVCWPFWTLKKKIGMA